MGVVMNERMDTPLEGLRRGAHGVIMKRTNRHTLLWRTSGLDLSSNQTRRSTSASATRPSCAFGRETLAQTGAAFRSRACLVRG